MRAAIAADVANIFMSNLTSSLKISLIDYVSGPAKTVAGAARDSAMRARNDRKKASLPAPDCGREDSRHSRTFARSAVPAKTLRTWLPHGAHECYNVVIFGFFISTTSS